MEIYDIGLGDMFLSVGMDRAVRVKRLGVKKRAKVKKKLMSVRSGGISDLE